MAKGLNKIKVLLSIALVVFMTLGIILMVGANGKANASENVNFKMRQTAELRLIDDGSNSGIRFIVDMDAQTKDKIASATEFGFIIAPTANFASVTDNFHAIKHVDVAFDQDQRVNDIYLDKESGLYRANGVLVDILDKNYDLDFSAVAYYKESAESNYVYADLNGLPSFSVNELACNYYLDRFEDELTKSANQLYIRSFFGIGASEEFALSISTEEQFVEMMNMRTPTYFKLANDITLSSYSLGTNKPATVFPYFVGYLNGNGKKLSFDINYGTDVVYKGLIDRIESGAVIKNLIFDGTVLSRHATGQGVFAREFAGTIESSVLMLNMKTAAAYANGPFGKIVHTATLTNSIILDNTANTGNFIVAGQYNYEDKTVLPTISNVAYVGALYSSEYNVLSQYVKRNDADVIDEDDVRAYMDMSSVYLFPNIEALIMGTDRAKVLDKAENGPNNMLLSSTSTVVPASIKQVIESTTLGIEETDDKISLKICDTVLKEYDKVINVSNKEEFIFAMENHLPTTVIKLTTDVDLGNMLTANGGKSSSVFDDFTGILDGNGYKLTYSISDDNEHYSQGGLFWTVSGTVKNIYIDATVNGPGTYNRATGALAFNLTGSLENCIIYKNSLRSGCSIQGVFGKLDATANVQNVLIVEKADSVQPILSRLAHEDATVKDVVYIGKEFGFTAYLPETVINMSNVFVFNNIDNASIGKCYYYLDNETYAKATQSLGSGMYDTTNWIEGGSLNKKIGLLLNNTIQFVSGQAFFGDSTATQTVSVSNLNEFVNAINTYGIDSSVCIKLTADVDLGNISTPESHAGYYFDKDFAANLDGNGHKLSYNLTASKDDSYDYKGGLFKQILGEIKNLELTASFSTTMTYNRGYGIFAQILSGLVKDCIFNVDSGSSSAHKSLFAQLSASAVVKNCVLVNTGTNATQARIVARFATEGAVISDLAFVSGYDYGAFTYALPENKISGLSNVYWYKSVSNLETGSLFVSLDVDTYANTEEFNNVNGPCWTMGGTMALDQISSSIVIENGQLKINVK